MKEQILENIRELRRRILGRKQPSWVAYDPDLVPPIARMSQEGIDKLEEWFRWGEEWSWLLRVYGSIKRNSRVLEIGCGLGRIAFPLRYILSSEGSYEGFDICHNKIKFLNQTFNIKYPNFNFQWADLKNTYYNSGGKISAENYRFPYADRAFDLVYAASVFTHMLPETAEHYFRETARVIAPEGRCLFSFFLLDYYQPGQQRPLGFARSHFNFDHRYGSWGEDFAIADPKNPEFMTAYKLSFIEELADRAGLELAREPIPGLWSGSHGIGVGAQDLLVLKKRASLSQASPNARASLASNPNAIAVSVVIPAHNAAATLAETLESLLAQTYPHWEAIVVDDGSKDDTAAIAAQFAARDPRIRTKRQLQAGVCTARNTGILLAQYDWLLFLDSDDWLAPEQLEKMTQKLRDNPDLDAVHCGWVRVAPDGTWVGAQCGPPLEDLFPTLAHYCPFAIHACLLRKSYVEAAGGFDPALQTCEDWDLWQRLARRGLRFGAIPDVLALYRMRQQSLSGDGTQFFNDGLRVLGKGYTSDDRVTNPLPHYANGLLCDDLSSLKLHWASWPAGIVLGCGKDARPLLQVLEGDRAPGLNPYIVAESIFESAVFPNCLPPSAWYTLWPQIEGCVKDFLTALEEQSQANGLLQRTCTILERKILQAAPLDVPLTIGKTYGQRIEITEPIPDLYPPAPVERLYCVVEMEGSELGRLELPICNGEVSSWVLKDAIAAQFAWQILGRFFERTVYEEGDRDSHDQIGWTVFLQQLWELDWPSDRFYDSEFSDPTATRISIESNERRVEVSEELCDLVVPGSELRAIFTVGGVAIAQLTIPASDNLVTAQALRVAITSAGGLELCRACVREGLIGQSWKEATSLRSRLVLAAQTRDPEPVERSKVLLARRPGLSGSVNRRAVFPPETAEDLLVMARVTGEAILDSSSLTEGRECPIYDPAAIAASGANLESVSQQSPVSSIPDTSDNTARFYGREHFETLFASQPDPWKYTSPYEQTKYEQTLSLLPSVPIHKALEIACAEGHFTAQLAPRVDTLLATDLSQIALDRTAQRCSHLNNVRFQNLDLTKDPIPGQFDLIVCSEVLYYVESLKALEGVAGKFADALEPGGYLLVAHAHQIIDEPDKPGYDWGLSFGAKAIGDTFARHPLFSLAKEIWTPLYRVQLFQRQPWQHSAPEILKLERQPTPVPPRVVSTVRWQGGQPSDSIIPASVTTEKLPVLMYHRVAPTGSSATARWRVTPEAFEEQLRYLRDAGFYSVSWEAWQAAAAVRRALPGRAIAITFDDGYQDFFDFAWPLLKKYGFTATVFIVAERVGESNRWDTAYGEDLPLMGWSEIRQLRAEGVVFGSHSATHRPLTALSAAEVVKEAARSRTTISRELGEAINTFAYPYGDFDPVVEHLIGACGYTFGLSCRSGSCRFQDSLLAIPRIEVMGNDSFQEFVAKLGTLTH